MRRLFTFLLFLFTGTAWLQAQTLRGQVQDKQGNGVPFANLRLSMGADALPAALCLSDENGWFTCAVTETQAVRIQVQATGLPDLDTLLQAPAWEKGNLRLVMAGVLVPEFTLEGVNILGLGLPDEKLLPGTAMVIEPRKVTLVQPLGAQEMLQYVPGINGFSDDGMGNSRINVGMRGLSPIRSSKVLFLEDGIPLQPALYVYPNMYYNPPAERIETYEVLKGAGALQYGPHTMGGVINYITTRPRADLGGKVQLTGGMNAFRSVYAEVGGFGSTRVQPELQLLYKGGSGYRDNNDFNQANATFKLNLLPDTKQSLYIKLNGNYEYSQATYTGLTEYSFRTQPRFNPKENDDFTVLRGALDLIYTRHYSERLRTLTKAYLSVFDRDWWREYDVFVQPQTYQQGDSLVPVPWYTPGDLMRVGNGRTNFGNLRSFRMMGAEHSVRWEQRRTDRIHLQLEAGARLHWERFRDDRREGSSPDDRTGAYVTTDTAGNLIPLRFAKAITYESTALSIYAFEEIGIGKHLHIRPGIRAELFEQVEINRMAGNRYTDQSTQVLLPGLGLNYALGDWNFFGGIHRGFTPPSAASFAIWRGAGADSAGFGILPEKSWNSELGLRYRGKYYALETSVFDLEIENLQAARGPAFSNLGRARTQGWESWAKLDLSPARSFLRHFPAAEISFTLLHTEILEGSLPAVNTTGTVDLAGKRLPYAPRYTCTAGLSKDLGTHLSLRADVYYVSLVYTDYENITLPANRGDQGPIPAYWLLNGSAVWNWGKHWRLSLTGKNLLDRVYIGSRLFSSPLLPDPSASSGILPGARRQVNLSAAYSF